MSLTAFKKAGYEQSNPTNLYQIKSQLNEIVSLLKRCPSTRLGFSGHSCSTLALSKGSDGCWGPANKPTSARDFSYRLSASRAAWVANWFVKVASKNKIAAWTHCPQKIGNRGRSYKVSAQGGDGTMPSSISPGCKAVASIRGAGGDSPVTKNGKIDDAASRRVDIEIIPGVSGTAGEKVTDFIEEQQRVNGKSAGLSDRGHVGHVGHTRNARHGRHTRHITRRHGVEVGARQRVGANARRARNWDRPNDWSSARARSHSHSAHARTDAHA